MRAAGYATGFSVRGGPDRRYAAHRYDINATDTARSFAFKSSRLWPAAAAAAARTPTLRAAAHRLIGSAR